MVNIQWSLWIVLAISLAITGVLPAKMLIRRVEYDTNPDYMTMNVKIINGTNGNEVNVDGTLKFDVSQGILVAVELDSKMGDEYMTMLGTTNEPCLVQDDSNIDPMVMVFNEEMKKFGNLTITCPYSKGYYHITKFHLTEENMLVKMAPPGDYILRFNVSHTPEGQTDVVPVFSVKFVTTIE